MEQQNNYFTAETEKWLECRRGRFTSSEIHKLFKGGIRNMTPEELAARPKNEKGTLIDRRTTVDILFGDTAMKYIEQKANEITSLNSEEEKQESMTEFKQMKYGKDNEFFGVEEFKRVTGLDVIYHGISCPEFYPFGDFAGGSPDGDIIGDSAVLEMKCPYNGAIHMKRLAINTIQDFKDKYPSDYAQCQMNMHIMNKDFCYYCSFDPRKINPKSRLKIFKLKKDPEWVIEFEMRLDAALGILADLLESYDKTPFVE